MVVRVRVLVSGRVQGVYFRADCEAAARAAGVAGWVRNRRDGRVEAVFEGTRDQVETMEAWVAHGSPESAVDSVERHDEPPEGMGVFEVWPTTV
ncbi:acylphosphatase [Yinghuangia seranimata]|uniref:acylphosphatase n=1 Tax=Yinghuangia seranimata TaxID=408067 RepID=UPI00248C3C20|nr:acylphosphatase [Yinghuangia seranimata]MDI2126930.1 acylphosphatase [Yinghuangia seranimata]